MTLGKHYFVKNSNATGEGEAYVNGNKSTNQIMVITLVKGSEISVATSAEISFQGKLVDSDEYIDLKAIKTNDYSLVNSLELNEAAYIDVTAYKEIQITVESTNGNISVIGEMID